MTEKSKAKRARKIADELDELGFSEVAEALRNALLSKEKGNATTSDEDNEDGETTTPPGGGSGPGPGKDRP